MTDEPEESQETETTKFNFHPGDGPGCGWWVITFIVCMTIYHVADLYFSHKH